MAGKQADSTGRYWHLQNPASLPGMDGTKLTFEGNTRAADTTPSQYYHTMKTWTESLRFETGKATQKATQK